jgi:NAD(P) transhydrogenase subunit beta
MGQVDYRWILGGIALGALVGAVAAVRVAMTSMPEMVAIFNGFGGAASTLVALAVVWQQLVESEVSVSSGEAIGPSQAFTVALSWSLFSTASCRRGRWGCITPPSVITILAKSR